MQELAELRAPETFALAQADEAARAAYATQRAALAAEHDRLRQQLTQLRETAALQAAGLRLLSE